MWVLNFGNFGLLCCVGRVGFWIREDLQSDGGGGVFFVVWLVWEVRIMGMVVILWSFFLLGLIFIIWRMLGKNNF